MLCADDPITWRPNRIAIAGVTGAGKTTLARRVSLATGVPYTELDSLYHGENWTPRPEFAGDVDRLTAASEWVIEWQYRTVRSMIAERADTLLWLDLPFRVSFTRVVRRTVHRRRTHQELWNGNREGPLGEVFADPEHIIRWALRTRRSLKAWVPRLESELPHLRIVRLHSARDVETWMTQLTERVSQ